MQGQQNINKKSTIVIDYFILFYTIIVHNGDDPT